MGHYALELKLGSSGFRIECQLHHYYRSTCGCGHVTQAKPGEGYISKVAGRKRDLKLTEYVLVAPYLASFIASLGVRFRMSRHKIREFLWDWTKTELSVGTIDRCIREAGGEGGKYSTLNCLNPTKLLKIPPFPRLCASGRRVSRTTANLQTFYTWMKLIGMKKGSFIGSGWQLVLIQQYFILALAEKRNYPIW